RRPTPPWPPTTPPCCVRRSPPWPAPRRRGWPHSTGGPMADKTIAVDFDGVIHGYSKGWWDGTIYDPPMPGALDGLRALMEHYAVFVHTTRSAGQVAEWLAGCGFDVVTDETCGRCQGAGGRAEPIDGQP